MTNPTSTAATTRTPELPFTLPHPLRPGGLNDEERVEDLRAFREHIECQADRFLGYQVCEHASYSQDLTWALDHHINNVGDPFIDGNLTINSKEFERDVLDYFARLWHAKTPHDPYDGESYWGYVVSMGATEGNMYGLFNARDYLAGRALLPTEEPKRLQWAAPTGVTLPDASAAAPGSVANTFTPVAFYSDDTHYSLTKAVRVLGIPTFEEIGNLHYPGQCPLGDTSGDGTWPARVPSAGGDDGPGTIDVDALCALVEFFAKRGYPPLINLTIGTTFKGAYDPVDEVSSRLEPILRHYGLYERTVEHARGDGTHTGVRHGFWIHVDGALGAAYLPHLKAAQARNDLRVADVPPLPDFDFSVENVSSIAVSGHKWIGAPFPCGIYMTKVKYQLEPPDDPEYIGSKDTTFAGSRNGFSSLVLWDHLASHGAEEEDRICDAMAMARWAQERLEDLSRRIHRNLWVARTPGTLTVRFRRPSPKIVSKYSLSTVTFAGEAVTHHYAHLYLMPGVTAGLINELISDLEDPHAWPDEYEPSPRASEHAAAAPIPAATTGPTVRMAGTSFQ